MTKFPLILTRAIAISVAMMAAGAAMSADINRSLTADGLLVYYGIVPARDLRNFPAGSEEAMAHRHIPLGQHVYHLVVAVFEKNNNERVTDVHLSARIQEPGLFGIQKPLDPTVLDGNLTFCNFFTLADNHEYRIKIDIQRPGDSQVVTANFNYTN